MTDTTFWSRIFGLLGFGGIQRVQGDQYPTPTAYAISAAKPVNQETALQVSAFWACSRLLAETVAGLPLVVYRTDGVMREVARDHPLAILFRNKPNRYQTRVEFFETMMLNLTNWGNAYAKIKRNGAGEIVSLMPLMSNQVVTRLLSDGTVVHEYHMDSGVEVIAEKNMWHIKLFGNGIIGLSPLAYARNSIGIAQAGEDRVTNIYRNGAKPSGILMVDASLNAVQRAAIRESFSELAEGNTDSLIVLDKHMKYEQVSMSPQDIELLASRRFQMEDIARFMGVPSVLINDTSGSTVWGSGVQQIIEGFYKLNLRPYLERFEASAMAHLMTPEDRQRYEIEFDFDGLLRMDAKSRMEGYDKAIQSGQMTPNEARALEGRSPMEGGDQLYMQGAMVPIIQAGRPQGNENGTQAVQP